MSRAELEALQAERVLRLLHAAAPHVPLPESAGAAVPSRRAGASGWVPGPPPGAVRSEHDERSGRDERTQEGPLRERRAGGRARRWLTWPATGPRERGRHRAPRPPLLAVPAALAEARFDVRRRAVVAVLAVALLASALFGVRLAIARQAAEPVPVSPARSASARPTPTALATARDPTSTTGWGAAAATAAAALAPGAPSPTPSGDPAAVGGRLLVVHVVGEVARPGVVRLGDGARAVDALREAGGALSSADLERVNLARALADGEQVHIPAVGEPILPGANGTSGGPGGGAPSGAGGSAGGSGGAPAGSGGAAGGVVDLNTADLALLDTLPGVGPVLAQRILDWRRDHGRFTSVDELGEVSGIGEKLLAQLTPKVRV